MCDISKIKLQIYQTVIPILYRERMHRLIWERVSHSSHTLEWVYLVCHAGSKVDTSSLTPAPKCHIYGSVNWVSIGSDNGLSPIRHQAIVYTNLGLLSNGTLGTNFSKILIKIQNCSFMKTHLKISRVLFVHLQGLRKGAKALLLEIFC